MAHTYKSLFQMIREKWLFAPKPRLDGLEAGKGGEGERNFLLHVGKMCWAPEAADQMEFMFLLCAPSELQSYAHLGGSKHRGTQWHMHVL